jgi:hypothetical protein
MRQYGIHNLYSSKSFICDFVFDVNLLTIKMHCCKVNHTTYIITVAYFDYISLNIWLAFIIQNDSNAVYRY